MNIIEAMKERRSVRSYNGEHLAPETIAELRKAAEEATSPFGGHVTIRLKSFDLKGAFKPSTYGMISGATEFFLLGIAGDKASALTAGFRFEDVVLRAWQMGLGTCWIAATFKGTDFERGETWPDGEELRIICPVGVAAKPSIKEKVTRLALGSKNRKPFDKLFFDGNFDTPLEPESPFGMSLEMMRLAPSSTNSQPWRALMSGHRVHFYYKPKSEASVLDCGIGLRHFYEAEKVQERAGHFSEDSNAPAAPEDWVYLVSYEPRTEATRV